jgi:hypothetical protein
VPELVDGLNTDGLRAAGARDMGYLWRDKTRDNSGMLPGYFVFRLLVCSCDIMNVMSNKVTELTIVPHMYPTELGDCAFWRLFQYRPPKYYGVSTIVP